MIKRLVVEGQELKVLAPGTVVRKGVSNRGILGADSTGIAVDNELFSKHILTLGSIGSGKSNLMYHISKTIVNDLKEDDILIYFDAKGDYLESFYSEGDIVLGNKKSISLDCEVEYWNIFNDILLDNDEDIKDTIREISTALFKKHIESSQNPTFLMGARDIFSALLTALIRDSKTSGEKWNNKKLKDYINNATREIIGRKLCEYPDLQWATSYISEKGATTQSYLSPLFMVVQEVLSGPFAKEGEFSIRKAVKKKNGKKIFLEYDIANSNTLQPIYTLLLDLSIKEALGNNKGKGSVYLMLDEFPLIPKLDYMDNALNFGRSIGLKVIAGIQNVGQVNNTYSKELASSILSGFGTYFVFKLFDEESRNLVVERHGKNRVKESILSTNNQKGITDTMINANVIEDWDIVKLNVGQCVVSLLNLEPFIFYPVQYK